MSGPQLADRLAALRPDLRVLFVSGYPHDSLEGGGLIDRRRNFLAKPFSASELLGRVRMLLSASAPVPS
jgi:DNA-binding response OmpR family regulator